MSRYGKIYVLAPDDNRPLGGVKELYRHVDVLNKNGFEAYILHSKPGFRCTWFENATRVAYKDIPLDIKSPSIAAAVKKAVIGMATYPFHAGTRITPSDYLVMPEVYAPYVRDLGPGVKKVIYNQNVHYSFCGSSLAAEDLKTPYLDSNVVATIVVSEHNLEYLRYAFPGLKVFRVHYGIDPSFFSCGRDKKPQIAFMPRKLPEQVRQVVNLLKFKGITKDLKLVPIEGRSEVEVAEILRESLIFLSFSTQEGCAMPPLEAMACGCMVIGYHGSGSKEYFREEFSCPVTAEDTLGFAIAVERAVNEYNSDRASFLEKGRKASEFVLGTYSLEREEKDILAVWTRILEA